MANLNVILSDSVTGWVESQTASGRFKDASAYVQDLIRRDQERAGRVDDLRRFIDEAEASGISLRGVDETLAEAKRIAEVRGLPE